MAEKKTIRRARKKAREGKAPTTQAGEFIREEMEHIRQGKHGARSPRQAIAIGLSKARRAGVKLPPRGGRKRVGAATRRRRAAVVATAPRRARARLRALQREPRSAASRPALSRFAKAVARRRGPVARRRAAQKAVRTKGRPGLRAAARRAARTRARR